MPFQRNAAGEIVVIPGTVAFQLDRPTPITAPNNEQNGKAAEVHLALGRGAVVFIAPVEGRYCHVGDDGVLVIDGTLHGYMKDV